MSDHNEEEEKERIHPFDRMFFGDRRRSFQEQSEEVDHEVQNEESEPENSMMDDFFGGIFKKKR